MFRLEYDEQAILRIEQDIEKTEKAVKDFRPAWQAVSDVLSEDFRKLFNAEGGFQGPAWARLSPVTVKWRKALGWVPIVKGWMTGRLAQSLIEPTHPAAIESRKRMSYTRGTRVNRAGFPYWKTFEGGRSRNGRQPRRPIAGRLLAGSQMGTTSRILEAIETANFGHLEK